MRGYFDNDFFGGHFGARFGGKGGPPHCPIRGDFLGHHGHRPGFGPFEGFDHSPERHGGHQHGPEHRRGDEDGLHGRRCSGNDRDGPPCYSGPSGRPSFKDQGSSCRRNRPGKHGHHGHEKEHPKSTEENHRGRRCGHHGASDSDSDGSEGHHCHGPEGIHCHGPTGFRSRGGHHGFRGHGPRPCFGRPRHFDFPNGTFRGPWEGSWEFDQPMNRFGRHGPTFPGFGHRRPCPYDAKDRPSRKSNCEKCRETEPCCPGDKENRGCGKSRKENGPRCDKDKDQIGDTVFVQRIVLEKATRPQSV